MAAETYRILLIDDNPVDAHIIQRHLQRIDDTVYDCIHCEDISQSEQTLKDYHIDCLLLDYYLGAYTGFDVLKELRAAGHDVPVVMLTGAGDELIAVEAMKQGIQDYMAKDAVTSETLQRAITNAMEKVSLARQLAEKHQELEAFTRVAAHDLKAPLARILCLCELLKDGSKEKLSEDEQELVDYIVENSAQACHLVDALLEYARVGRSEIPLRSIRLSEVMTIVCDNLETVIQESHGRVEVGEMPMVRGDEVALVQLFQNLIANALKFRGDIPPVVTIQAQQEGEMWHITVADNGIGIAPEHHDTIFVVFQRLDSQGQYEGTGLGLATCKRVVNQHHGRIWVE